MLNLYFQSFLFWKGQVKGMDDIEHSLDTSFCRLMNCTPVTRQCYMAFTYRPEDENGFLMDCFILIFIRMLFICSLHF